MGADIEKEFSDAEIEFLKSSGGVFEVSLNGKLIFSKKGTGRFPTTAEITAKIKAFS